MRYLPTNDEMRASLIIIGGRCTGGESSGWTRMIDVAPDHRRAASKWTSPKPKESRIKDLARP